jgi:hypothetical protein
VFVVILCVVRSVFLTELGSSFDRFVHKRRIDILPMLINILTLSHYGRVNGCEWDWDSWTCAYAAERGHLDVLQWARANGCPDRSDAI